MADPEVVAVAAPSAFWDGAFMVRLRAYVLPSIAFALPVFFAQKFLQHLSGGALWFPREWRETIAVFGTAIGLAIFNLSRIPVVHAAVERARARVAHVAEPVHEGKSSVDHGAERARLRRALGFYTIAFAFVVGYAWLRYFCVRSWQPREAWLEHMEIRNGGAESLPSFIELHAFGADAPSSVSAEEHGGSTSSAKVNGSTSPPAIRGSFFVPIAVSDATRAALDRRERDHGIDGVEYCLEQDEDWLIDTLATREPFWMPFTTLLFLAAHLGVLCFAAAGFGSAFSVSEILAERLAELT